MIVCPFEDISVKILDAHYYSQGFLAAELYRPVVIGLYRLMGASMVYFQGKIQYN